MHTVNCRKEYVAVLVTVNDLTVHPSDAVW